MTALALKGLTVPTIPGFVIPFGVWHTLPTDIASLQRELNTLQGVALDLLVTNDDGKDPVLYRNVRLSDRIGAATNSRGESITVRPAKGEEAVRIVYVTEDQANRLLRSGTAEAGNGFLLSGHDTAYTWEDAYWELSRRFRRTVNSTFHVLLAGPSSEGR